MAKPSKDDKARIEKDLKRAEELIGRMLEIRAACKSGQHKPGTAEILDALTACFELNIRAGDKDWKALTLAMGWKNSEEPPASVADTQRAVP